MNDKQRRKNNKFIKILLITRHIVQELRRRVKKEGVEVVSRWIALIVINQSARTIFPKPRGYQSLHACEGKKLKKTQKRVGEKGEKTLKNQLEKCKGNTKKVYARGEKVSEKGRAKKSNLREVDFSSEIE